MTVVRKKTVGLVYNGVEMFRDLEPYLEQLTYTDAVDESDTISLGLLDRDLKWSRGWIPQNGDALVLSLSLENWNYEGERMTMVCGSFVVDDFSFSAPPLKGSINGVSSPVATSFKETQNTRTWEAATVQVVAEQLAGKYGLTLTYEAEEIPISKMEQDKQTDSDFLKKLCEKYGLGLKVYYNRLVIWDYQEYFSAAEVMTLRPSMCSKWSYRSTMQGTYTGARVSYTDPNTKKSVDVLVGTEERLYKTTQKADSEADARRIGEAAILGANRKETTMQLTLPPRFALMATRTVRLEEFGKMDGKYFVERVSHQISRNAYTMQVSLSRIPESEEKEDRDQDGAAAAQEQGGAGSIYTVQKGDTLWDLSQKFYGTSSRSSDLYEANRALIEEDARRHGKKSSSQGYWIWPGLRLTIPL